MPWQGPAGPQGPQGTSGLTDLESDGPYSGATDLGDVGTNGSEGDNSEDMWAPDGSRQTSWVQCPTGKTAIGGGFHAAADAGAVVVRPWVVCAAVE